MNAVTKGIQSFEEFEAESVPIITPPFVSKFGAVRWNQIRPGVSATFDWLVEDMIPAGGVAMIAGASQSGKTFLALDLAMAIARGERWFERDVMAGGVIYFAAEDPTGVRSLRIPAYQKANSLSADDDIPFVLLTERLNLWEAPERADELIVECKALEREMTQPLRMIVIDTYSKATTGSDELSGKEMSVIMDRMERINRQTGATVVLVDHLNASGSRVRGVAPKTANIDAVLICRLATKPGEKRGEVIASRDADNRKIREFSNDIEWGGKVKNGGAMERPCRFVLHQVVLGTKPNGKPETSCVLALPAGEEITTTDGKQRDTIGIKLTMAMRGLKTAIEKNGRRAPDTIENAPNGMDCVTLTDWRKALAPLMAGENEDPEKLKERVKKARDRAAEVLILRKYIVKDGDWVWRTGRKVPGLDYIPREAPPERAPAPPEPTESYEDVPF